MCVGSVGLDVVAAEHFCRKTSCAERASIVVLMDVSRILRYLLAVRLCV